MKKIRASIITTLATVGAVAAILSGCHSNRDKKNIPELSTEINALLQRLDSTLVQAPAYVRTKEERLDKLRASYNSATDATRRYWLAADLYDEYCAYNPDSAMVYVDRAVQQAGTLERQDLINEMELNRSYLYSATGQLEKAEATLDRINLDSLPTNLALKFCERQLFLSTHRDQYLGITYEKQMYSQKMDSLLQDARRQLTPESPNYGWLIGWSSLNSKESAAKAIPIVEAIVDASGFSTRAAAMDAWVLARLYEKIDDNDNYLKYLILSATADIRACNKEVASLQEVAENLHKLGHPKIANNYINHCILWANEYKSRTRIAALAHNQESILGEIHDSLNHQAKLNNIYLAAVCAALLVLAVAALQILRQNRKLKTSRSKLSDTNSELNRHVGELQAIRAELNSANSKLSELYESTRDSARQLSEINDHKEEYIANIFTICSSYISKHEDFRANLHRQLMARKFDQAMQLVKSPELSYGEIRELYAIFDRIFLKIYPDFVVDFNTLLRPEEQIELKDPEKLTTELRIYALVRLGLNDSVKIAKFLHCSVQTVYNSRQRMRNKANVARDEFALRVRALGKPAF